jgi:hypothetical protein
MLRLANGPLLRLAARAPRRVVRACSSSSSSASSVDDALRAALSQVASRVAAADPEAQVLSSSEGVPGVRTPGPKMLLRFTCANQDCEEAPTITRVISKRSYEQGIVLVRCPSCEKRHLIADNLDWFGGGRENIEHIMAEKGEAVQRGVYEEDLLHLDDADNCPAVGG